MLSSTARRFCCSRAVGAPDSYSQLSCLCRDMQLAHGSLRSHLAGVSKYGSMEAGRAWVAHLLLSPMTLDARYHRSPALLRGRTERHRTGVNPGVRVIIDVINEDVGIVGVGPIRGAYILSPTTSAAGCQARRFLRHLTGCLCKCEGRADTSPMN